jgi:hypothetical protein
VILASVFQEGGTSVITRTRKGCSYRPDLPSQSPIRGERKQARLRTTLRKGHLFHRQINSVWLLSCPPIIASVFF